MSAKAGGVTESDHEGKPVEVALPNGLVQLPYDLEHEGLIRMRR